MNHVLDLEPWPHPGATEGETNEHRRGIVVRMPVAQGWRRDHGGAPGVQRGCERHNRLRGTGDEEIREPLIREVEEDRVARPQAEHGQGI